MPRKSSSNTERRSTTTRRRGKRTTIRRSNSSTTRGEPGNARTRTTRGRGSDNSTVSSSLSSRTRKAIDTLPSHAQKIYSKAHKSALKQYATPSKRRGGKGQSKEQVAHKVAWSAVKKEYKKKGDKWVPKKD
jgi:cation transport regulator